MSFIRLLTRIGLFTFFFGALVAQLVSAADAKPSRPNVLIILSDDQGYGDVGRHGNPVIKTPNLDRLHDQSIRLTDFHVAPMCTPTRGQLMTGLDALHSGASSVCAGRSFMRRGTATMAELFADAGYQTGHFGKWHLGDSYPNLPHQRGFQETVYHLGWGITSMADTWLNDCFDGRYFHNGKLRPYPGYCTDVWFNRTMDYMRDCQQRRQPFFVYLPTNAPHGPHWVDEKYKQPYEGRGPAEFFGMIANLDENLGRLDEFMKKEGLLDNTIVIYFNDNGGTGGVKLFNAGMRGMKTTYYEGGHRAMCFIRWPGGKFTPRAIDELTEVQDLLPTLTELCSLKAKPDAPCDGVSLAGLLSGKADHLPDRKLVVQYGQRPEKFQSAVLWKKWRLVGRDELYDLKSDFGQQTNVADKHPDVLNSLREHYESWWDGVLPKLEDFSPVSIGAKQENPVCLSAADWANVYCDNMMNLRQGVERNGPWHVLVEQDGQYEISLRRWPREADAPIAGGVPEFKAHVGGLPAGKVLPVVKVRLKVGDSFDKSQAIKPDDKQVTFIVQLKAGEKLPMQSWLYGEGDRELAGAYFAYVTRK